MHACRQPKWVRIQHWIVRIDYLTHSERPACGLHSLRLARGQYLLRVLLRLILLLRRKRLRRRIVLLVVLLLLLVSRLWVRLLKLRRIRAL